MKLVRTAIVGGVFACTAALADVSYVSQSRSVTASVYGASNQSDQSTGLGAFNRSLSGETFLGDGNYRSFGSATVASLLTPRSIDWSLGIVGVDEYPTFGVGGGGGMGSIDVQFTVAAPMRFDFIADIRTQTTGPNYTRTLFASLRGTPGTVFQTAPMLTGTQSFGGTLAPGNYHLLVSHDFAYGGTGSGSGSSDLYVNLTVPTPAGCAVLALGALAARRRRG